MKINEKVLSIPPYISTSWKEVRSLKVEQSELLVILLDQSVVRIPNLNEETLLSIFEAHQKYLELQVPSKQERKAPSSSPLAFSMLDPSLQLSQSSMETLGTALQHNPELADAPDLPQEILNKIQMVVKVLAPEAQLAELHQAEPHCNCPHCQIAKAIQKGLTLEGEIKNESEIHDEEVVPDEELVFEQWEIRQTGEKLYVVINKLDTDERYSVYLGHPVGCTCGKEGCEHILAVLRS